MKLGWVSSNTLSKRWGFNMAANLGGMMSQLTDYKSDEIIPNSYVERDAAQNAGVTNPLLRGLMKSGAKALGGTSMESPQEQAKGVMEKAMTDGTMDTAKGIANLAAKMSSIGMQEQAMKLLALSESRQRNEKDDAWRREKEDIRQEERNDDVTYRDEALGYKKGQDKLNNERLAANTKTAQDNLELGKKRFKLAQTTQQKADARATLAADAKIIARNSVVKQARKSGDEDMAVALAEGSMTPAQYWQQDINKRAEERARAAASGKRSSKTNTPAPEGWEEVLMERAATENWGEKAGIDTGWAYFDDTKKTKAAANEAWAIWDNSPPGTSMDEAVNRYLKGVGPDAQKRMLPDGTEVYVRPDGTREYVK